MAGANERHQYHNDTSSDTEDYNDDRRRRVFKNRLRYLYLYNMAQNSYTTYFIDEISSYQYVILNNHPLVSNLKLCGY